MQARALSFSDQVDPRRANTRFLEEHHGKIWLGEDSRLKAVGASGPVLAKGTPGTTYIGSTTIGDPVAVVGTDPNGLRYQVLFTDTIPASGELELTIKGIDTGFVTNQAVGTVITWSENVPLGSEPQAAVIEQVGKPGVGLDGGFDRENNDEYGVRIEDRIKNRPASGNANHFRAWARQATTATEDAFIYPAVLAAGSVVVSPTQKRNQNATDGPNARIMSAGTLLDVSSFLTPPGSPVVPQRVFVLVVTPNPQESDIVVRLSMSKGGGAGWADVEPWPEPTLPADPTAIEQVKISAVTSQTEFDITTSIPLPGVGVGILSGDDAPQLMVWDKSISRFEELDVLSVEQFGALATVILNTAPDRTLAIGDRISPFTDRLDIIAETTEDYFDSLGPGQLVQATDPRFSRSGRRPLPADRFPIRAGAALISRIEDALGGVAPDGDLTAISRNEPDIPSDISDGPNLVTLGDFNIYPL
jgi:hypothetical protein